MPSRTADQAELQPSFNSLPTRRDYRAREGTRGFRQIFARRNFGAASFPNTL